MPTRRSLLRSLSVCTVALAGCTGSDVPDEADVVAGPDTRLTFDPETLTVSVGDTVTWYFDSQNHNVCGVPDHHDEVSIPDGADPFASYEGDNRYETVEQGETYSHTFETPGEYAYVCVPHAPGMAGRIVVEE